METKSRTATQLLLEIEQSLMTLIKAVAVIDHNQKLMLNRLNDSKSTATITNEAPKVVPITVVSQKPLLEISQQPRASARQNAPAIDQPKTQPGKSVQAASNDTGSKIPVLQKVVDANGKDAFMTTVSIREKETSKEWYLGRTNTAGKWAAHLPAGTYIAKLSKTNQETKELMEFYQEFEVALSMKTLALPNFVLKK